MPNEFMNNVVSENNYDEWFKELKNTIQKSQIKAAVFVNQELLNLYWNLGRQIVEKQQLATWGSGFINQLSKDLKVAFPSIKGFSKRNLELIRQFYLYYSDSAITKQLVSQNSLSDLESLLFSVPWGHHILLMQKNKNPADSIFYLSQIVQNNWSRATLEYQIETNLHKRQGNSINNFKSTLPMPDSDLANQLLKDPYNFDFLTLEKSAKEKDLERNLINNITHFLLELGSGFAYLGKQFLLKVGTKEYRTDLLFYHIHLYSIRRFY